MNTEFIFEGTVKQIEWATQIRDKVHVKMQRELSEANERVNGAHKDMPNYWAWCVRDAIDFIGKYIAVKEGNKAGDWITYRNRIGGYPDYVNPRATKRYEALKAAYGYQDITKEQYDEVINKLKGKQQ